MNKNLEEKYLEKLNKIDKEDGEHQYYNPSWHDAYDGAICEFLEEAGFNKLAEKYKKAYDKFYFEYPEFG